MQQIVRKRIRGRTSYYLDLGGVSLWGMLGVSFIERAGLD